MPLPTSSPEANPVSQSNRLPGAALVAAAALLAGVAFASAQAPGRNSRSTAEKADHQQTTKKPDFRLREGEEITDEAGYFSMTGDRVTFFTDGGTRRLVGLENLNLQRIIQEIEDGTGTSSWVVSGTITEFRGGNYILVSRAMLKQQ